MEGTIEIDEVLILKALEAIIQGISTFIWVERRLGDNGQQAVYRMRKIIYTLLYGQE